ncbi:MAG: hypothetical protein BGO32_04740 [Bacteroidetes bacterium 37-13]|nr:MAG: hypothetical protein BGO32_04740 [Bacteroidetes bacterium 37-13]
MRGSFLIITLLFLSFSAFTKPKESTSIKEENKKCWVEDSVKKLRYMPKVLLNKNKDWKPENTEIGFQISSATLSGKKKNSLETKVKYGGGCRVHSFQLIKPIQASKDTLQLYLVHESDNDMCRAFVMNEIKFNVSKLKLKKNTKVIMLNNFQVK